MNANTTLLFCIWVLLAILVLFEILDRVLT